jgi:macrolide transport system ATP-binding/permease protein
MNTLLQDVRYAIRVLRQSPGFIAVAVLSLGLGIGANTAIFSLIDAALFRPLPVDAPDRLVSIFTTDKKNPGNLPMSHLNYLDYRDNNQVFSGVAAFTFGQMNLTTGSETEQAVVQVVSGNYFSVLGLRAQIGRTFLPEEDQTPNSHPVVVMGHGLWERRFGRDPAVVGKTVSLNRRSFTVVGVAPKGFTGTFIFGPADFWVPMMMHGVAQPGFDWYNERRGLFLFVFGRLKPNVTIERARAEMSVQARRLEQAYQNDNDGRGTSLLPLLETRVNPNGRRRVFTLAGLLMTVVGIVLLIACANLAGILLARAAGRRKEIAIRLALGATRVRVTRLLLTESLVISIASGAIGLLLSYWTLTALLSANLPLPFPVALNPGIDARVLGFAFILSILTGLLFGLAPAIQASRPDVVTVLKNELVAAGGRLRGLTLRKALVVFQVALSLAALIAAGLFLRSLRQAQAVDPGFEINKVLVMTFNLGREGYTPERGRLFYEQVAERMAGLPGARSASIAQDMPFAGGMARSVFLEGQQGASRNGTLVQLNIVDPHYFEALGIPLLRGRAFTSADRPGTPQVVVVNQTMADQFWKGQDPIGKRFKFFGDEQYTEVIGVVKDSKYNALVEDPQPFLYRPLAQNYTPDATLHVRTAADAAALVATVRNAVHEIDPRLTVFDVRTLKGQVDRSLAPQRLNVWLLTTFGVVASLLAAIGIYGVASYSVSQRTREIGIRMALGAARHDVLRLVLRQGLALIVIGVAVGLGGALIVTRLLSSLLFGVRATDLTTFVTTALMLTAVAVLATYIPARRATRVDPLMALRYE